ncbi:MAG: hypothetical protein HYY20_03955 [Candidatus Tectomicrobia bacterium]|uniref:Uncharacterized protein n=1 Tax=Tectimicrobiota bacterium TaxID=2528274 RepID=A0A932FW16_UNCTE|nr:hypothetical protein [Candidatus Tectomicrobia bacterium]
MWTDILLVLILVKSSLDLAAHHWIPSLPFASVGFLGLAVFTGLRSPIVHGILRPIVSAAAAFAWFSSLYLDQHLGTPGLLLRFLVLLLLMISIYFVTRFLPFFK